MHMDKSDCEGPNADDHCESVFPIPDEIPDSKLEEYFLRMKSNYEPCYRATLDKAARTITFSQQPLKLMPGPALNKYGVLELNTFFVYFPENRATKLKAAWPEVELTLDAYSLSCDLNLAKCCMQVSTTPSLEDPCMIEKARHLLELLSTTLVPPYMALEIFQEVRQQETINIGFQQGGICSKFGIKKDDYLKRWKCLFCSLKALSKATHCHIFLDENTFTAVTTVGSSVERISQLKAVVEDCITKNLCPSTSIRRFETEVVMYQSMDDLDDPHAKHTECLKSGPLSDKDGMLEVCSLYALLHERRVSKLEESLPMLESSLRNYGISYTLDKNSMVLSATRGTEEPDIIDKAWQLLELLSTTHVPASMAIELLDCLQTCLIKIGNQEGGLCSLFGIKEEEYRERWECLRHSLQILAEVVECNVFLNDNTVAAVGETSVVMVKQLVENCILHNLCPGTAAKNYNYLSEGVKSIEDPHVQHMDIGNSGSAMMVMPELSSFCMFFDGEQATRLEKDWKCVEACLKKHGISCKLIAAVECCMIVSKTTNAGDPDITDKIWDFLKLLSIDVEPSKAIEVLNGRLHFDFIPTGYIYGGGLCSKFRITEEQFAEVVWPRIERGLEEISTQLKCEYIISPNFITVWGPGELGVFRRFVEHCFCFRPRPTCVMRARIKGRFVPPFGCEARAFFFGEDVAMLDA
ncbi:uncharacterized protein LOC112179536 isoform X1 [Rosa chinensis]|nr:uncharacterized protein LOC112179536 isoform X1 [Rosa chinensis]